MFSDASDLDPAEPPRRDEDELRAVARAWTRAIVANDPVRMATFVTDDWVIISESGVSLGTSMLALVASGALSHSAMEIVSTPLIRVVGSTATVTSRMTNTAYYDGRRFDADEWTTDVYVRSEGRWRCALTHYTTATAP